MARPTHSSHSKDGKTSKARRTSSRSASGSAKRTRGPIWTREETLAAFYLYSSMPFGQIHDYDSRVSHLAKLLNRTPGSVAMKMGNLTSYDPKHQERGVKGLKRPCKTEKLIWDEFWKDPIAALREGEQFIAKQESVTFESEMLREPKISDMPEGLEKERVINVRSNQGKFRHAILFLYNHTCCITGIAEPALLIASHIVPWSENRKERLNPRNGLCLNALHDRAFDRGLISVDPDCKIRVSKRILKAAAHSKKMEFLAETDGEKIKEPDKFRPNPEFLDYHYRNVFIDQR